VEEGDGPVTLKQAEGYRDQFAAAGWNAYVEQVVLKNDHGWAVMVSGRSSDGSAQIGRRVLMIPEQAADFVRTAL
jgi:hypothetical protein